MSGNATLTIDRSSDAMNVPRAVTMNTAPDRGAAVAGPVLGRRATRRRSRCQQDGVEVRQVAGQLRFDEAARVVSQHLGAVVASAAKVASTTLLGVTFGASTPAAMSVSMNPTCTPTTSVPCGANSTRKLLVNDHAAAFAAEYIAVAGIDSHDSTDNTLTIAPPPLTASRGANTRLMAIGPNTLVSISRRPCSRASVAKMPVRVEMPALLTNSVTSPAGRRRFDVAQRGDVQAPAQPRGR